jgi:hypothetical protein
LLGEVRSGQDMTEESQNALFEVTSKQIHGFLYWHLGEMQHNIEADHYVTSVDLERTQDMDKFYRVFNVVM